MQGKPFEDVGDNYMEPDDVGDERARELFQFYRPSQAAQNDAGFLPFPDTVLQAHAQLAALRVDARRAIVALVDTSRSYFVAEATKSLDLEDISRSEHAEDGIQYGNIGMPKDGGLVEWTLAQVPRTIDGQGVPAHYEVIDMANDPRWRKSQFVSSKPASRYYCGLPLRTENNINIGVLFVLDDHPRASISPARLKVLSTIANNIMAHMKTLKDAHEKQRAIYMNLCMADLISPDHRFRSRHLNFPKGFDTINAQKTYSRRNSARRFSTSLSSDLPFDLDRSQVTGNHLSRSITLKNHSNSPTREELHEENHILSDEQGRTLQNPFQHKDAPLCPDETEKPVSSGFEEPEEGAEKARGSDAGDKFGPDHRRPTMRSKSESTRSRTMQRETRSEGSSMNTVDRKTNVTEADHQRAFDRAAYLLRQSLDLSQFGGGVVLLDTNALVASTDSVNKRPESGEEVPDGLAARPSAERRKSSAKNVNTANISGSIQSGGIQERVVLAAASVNDTGEPPQNFGRADPTWKVTLTPPELQRMCTRYPRGKLYNIPEQVGMSLFDFEGRAIRGRLSASLTELVLLRRQFPKAHQVIFVPVFHANLNRWTSCFAFTNSRYRVFSYEMDYLPMLSFTSAIKAEITRLATVFADQKKSDFIGSVSHELRSPLHGILASLEFLEDTELDAFQTSCVKTMDACAHTLLDTIAMILDYNKVNTMERKLSTQSQPSSHGSEDHFKKMPTTANPRNQPLFAMNQNCDVALITEEVIDGLATGQLAKVRTNFGFDDTASETDATRAEVGGNSSLRRVLQAVRPEVELILDVHPPAQWTFSTQPGALRRIVMNLFDNALKYTKHGYIKVSLRWVDSSHDSDPIAKPTMVKLTVSDTGQGISSDYLRTKIFTPFAQENAKAAGAGLGLSIVRTIVSSLKGEIDIKSMVNVGTIVEVTLPMKKARSSPTITHDLYSNDELKGASERMLISAQHRMRDPSVTALQRLQDPPQIAIFEPAMVHDNFDQSRGSAELHTVLVQYLKEWFGLPTLHTWNFYPPAKLLIVDEMHVSTMLARRPDYLDTVSLQSIIILCANPARQAILSKDIKSARVALISKPFGPYKLARVIGCALDKAASSPPAEDGSEVQVSPERELDGVIIAKSEQSSQTSRSANLQESTSGSWTCGPLRSRIRAEAHADGLLGHDPLHRIALTTPEQTFFTEVSAGRDGGFPFEIDSGRSRHDNNLSPGADSVGPRPRVSRPHSTEVVPGIGKQTVLSGQLASSRNDSSLSQPSVIDDKSSPQDGQPGASTRKPRLLLVDDNRLNLQLLHTYISKKGYGESLVRTADDGQKAVDVYQEFVPDIVFMDISMPVMDGLEATRVIRQIEKRWRKGTNRDTPEDEEGLSTIKPALVVAITGNAKASDQAEAVRCGMDLYMTKPVSFREIGKLLGNWKDA